MNMLTPPNDFGVLQDRCSERGLEAVIDIKGRGQLAKPVITIRSQNGKIVESIEVHKVESIDKAAARLRKRMTKAKIL